MDLVNVLFLAFSLALDAMVVSSTNGIKEPGMKWWKALLIAFAFGFFQMAMPAIGYFAGFGFRDAISAAIPWIAFGLLLLLSLKCLVEFIRSRHEEEKEEEEKLSGLNLLFQAIATSIDALCVGFALLALSWSEALVSFSIIGGVTFALSLGMVYVGKLLGSKIDFFHRYAALISAIVFFGVGLKILLEGIL